jgi:Protein of unknown function (DUF3485)
MKRYRAIFAAPAACAVLLVGIFAESQTRLKPADAEPYHARAKAAIESIPRQIGSWSANPVKEPQEAISLLRPNDILCLQYVDNDQSQPRWYERTATVLVVQCKDAADMNGHWPPNCYVNSGEVQTYREERNWTVDGLVIPGVEYHFLQTSATESTRKAVYNFLIVPDRGIFRDMDGVRQAASDYQRRFYGAAQFQVVMNADLSQQERDEIFTTLMQPCVTVIRTLQSGETK